MRADPRAAALFFFFFFGQVAISRANSPESTANLRAWRLLAAAPDRWSWRWAAQAWAAAEHLCLSLTHESDSLVKLMQVGVHGVKDGGPRFTVDSCDSLSAGLAWALCAT